MIRGLALGLVLAALAGQWNSEDEEVIVNVADRVLTRVLTRDSMPGRSPCDRHAASP